MSEISRKYKYSDIVSRMLDPKFLCTDGNGERSAEFSSYDRASRYEFNKYVNWSANGDGSGYISNSEDGGIVIAEMEGPGYISRIWSARPETGHVKIFIDGDATPTIDMPFEDYFNGKAFAFNKLCYVAARGANCYVPISYNKSCKVVAYEGWGCFYQINYTSFPKNCEVDSVSYPFNEEQMSALSKVNEFLNGSLGTNPCACPDAELEKMTVNAGCPAVKALEGEGAVCGLLVKIPELDGISNTCEDAVRLLKNLRIKIYWDNEDEASIDAPLGDFFGSCYGVDSVKTLLYGVRDDKTFYSYYYMPYKNGAKIEISTMSDKATEIELAVNRVPLENVNGDILYLNAFFNRGKYSDILGRYPDHIFLKAEGKGRFVGVNLHVSKLSDARMTRGSVGYNWWGEGDEKIFVDGESFPSWFGTGTEDFFGFAWCAPTLFSESYHAQSYCVGGIHNKGNRSYTRILMADSIPFNTSFEGCLEKYYPGEIVKYGYTPFFYMKKGGNAERPKYSESQYFDYFEFDAE